MIPDDVYLTEEERKRLEDLEKSFDVFDAKVRASGMDVIEYLQSQGYMTDEEDEWHKELVKRAVPIG